MRDFTHKLSASGWDIGKQKTQLVTGFSGTNDSRYLLPLDVKQLDLPEHRHTNAMVLEWLLQDGNSVKLLKAPSKDSKETISLLVTIAQIEPGVQVILDVGAQILELSNMEVASSWLSLTASDKEAAVFVNDEDELCVLDRDGRAHLLHTSPYADRLDSCLVFLDESHTRGIDLKLPINYRAAVTLGANVTKDRLIQACMRMRKLGNGQTVVFCVPPEIQARISSASQESDAIAVSDVLRWSIGETYNEVHRSMPLWAVQGQRFLHQQSLLQQVTEGGVTTLSQSHAMQLLEIESQTLEQRYRPQLAQSDERPATEVGAKSESSRFILDRCHEFGKIQISSSVLHEEQERELSPEIEQERQVQRPPSAVPALHVLDGDVRQFALADTIGGSSNAYTAAFESLQHLKIGDTIDLSKMVGDGKLMVSVDFATTVQPHGVLGVLDAFQRHVNWVVTRPTSDGSKVDSALIISPFEANLLYPHMEDSSNSLHVFKPRSNSAYAALDDLNLHTVSANKIPANIPKALAAQLSLFSGQLYIRSYADYLEICQRLGLAAYRLTEAMESEGWRVDANGFILRDGKGQPGGSSGLLSSPVNFFKVFLSKIRRNGDGIGKTHMGSILGGNLLSRADWDQSIASSGNTDALDEDIL